MPTGLQIEGNIKWKLFQPSGSSHVYVLHRLVAPLGCSGPGSLSNPRGLLGSGLQSLSVGWGEGAGIY